MNKYYLYMKIKELLEDFWLDLTCYYPRLIKESWWKIKNFFWNTWRYRDILSKDFDFDFGYLELLIMKKLEFMAEYFRVARIIVDEEKIYHQINLTLRIGKIAFELDVEENPEEGYDGYEYTGYVNTRNYQRFWWGNRNPTEMELKILKTEMRRSKARHLFYTMLARYSHLWSD